MDVDSIATVLRGAGPCVALDPDEAVRIARAGEVRELAAREELIIEGDASHEMFILLDGAAEVWKVDPGGHGDLKIAEISAGESIGELSMLHTERRLATVRTTRPCRVFVLGRESFDALVAAGDPAAYKIGLQLARVVASRMLLLHDRFLECLRNGAPPTPEFTSFKRELLSKWDF